MENNRLNVQESNAQETEEIKENTSTEQGNNAETKADYANGEEKLLAEESEMLSSVKPEFQQVMRNQLDLIFSELISWTKQDPEFDKKVLLNHKSMKRCMKFCADKAMGLREPSEQEKADARNRNAPIMTPVRSDMLFEWIKEYYDKDDKAEIEKEEKRKQKAEDRKKETKKTNDKKPLKEEKLMERKEVPTGVPKNSGKDITGQISMFDLLGV